MTRWLAGLLLGLGACAGLNVESPAGCASACELAYTCGFLPSSLGYADSAEAARKDCLRLCNGSPADGDVKAILGCLPATPDEDATGWCPDADDPEAVATGQQCSAAAQCLTGGFPDLDLLGGVELEVALITFTEFATAFDEQALVDLYSADLAAHTTDDPDNSGVDPTMSAQTCNQSLCGGATCKQGDESADDPPCDDTLCGSGMFQAGQTCSDLGARTVDLAVIQPGVPMASQVLLDTTEPSGCKTTSFVFESSVYHLRPGPLRTNARIAGVLTPAALTSIDYPLPADIDPGDTTTPIDYCLRFPGLAIQARSGDSLAVVPIGDIEQILAFLPDPTLRPRPCDQ